MKEDLSKKRVEVRWINDDAYIGRCPFKREHSPSLSVRKDLGTYKCYRCDKQGSTSELAISYVGGAN